MISLCIKIGLSKIASVKRILRNFYPIVDIKISGKSTPETRENL